MLKSIKNEMLKPVQEEYDQIEQNKRELESKRDMLYAKLDELDSVSFKGLSKIFKRKEIEQNKNELEKTRLFIDELREQINELNKQLNILWSKKQGIVAVTSLEELNMTEEEILNFINEHSIEVSNIDKVRYFGNTLCNNIDFMKELIEENPLYIIYDRTNNPELYISFLNKIQNDKEDVREIVYFLNNYENMNETDSKIMQYVFEHIRITARHKIDNEDRIYIQGIGISYCLNIEAIRKLYNTEYGRELEQLYLNPNIIVGIHQTSRGDEEKIFTDGLLSSTQPDALRELNRTVAYQVSFLKMLDYAIFGSGSRGSKDATNYIITVPREGIEGSTPIWGSNNFQDHYEKDYLLPEYVYGCVKLSDEVPSIKRNEILNKTQYKDLFLNYGNEPINMSTERRR